MKGYYITYGIFMLNIENIILELENELVIDLIKNGYDDDKELYHLGKSLENKITNFSIYSSNKDKGYKLINGKILYPEFIISCNVILKDENDSYVDELRSLIESKESIKELNFEEDEW
ncbi:hypothetical protein EH230_09175 [Flavobacterium columnare]|uniref:Uncharacterized protein n=1 Tax=Flavobacterium columnare TaxID=996 RepID=A0A437UBN7_9FLAO|nr:hypothetical protein [Flavobacterium columnare]RVU91054.1 hypothetical protein EH230_09175 [Flavobacterium columnare]